MSMTPTTIPFAVTIETTGPASPLAIAMKRKMSARQEKFATKNITNCTKKLKVTSMPPAKQTMIQTIPKKKSAMKLRLM